MSLKFFNENYLVNKLFVFHVNKESCEDLIEIDLFFTFITLNLYLTLFPEGEKRFLGNQVLKRMELFIDK